MTSDHLGGTPQWLRNPPGLFVYLTVLLIMLSIIQKRKSTRVLEPGGVVYYASGEGMALGAKR